VADQGKKSAVRGILVNLGLAMIKCSASACAALIVLYNAWKLLRPAVLELADIGPDPSLESQVRTIAGRVPGVLGLDKCFIRKMGFSF
jgi:divalent metal cation (Fe/Co/Zn/Cd) transporter